MELQITNTTLPQIISNYQEMKVYLVENLKQYEIQVTQANLPQAKKMATELNSLAKQIDDKRKDTLSSVEEPIDIFKNQIKELVGLCKNGREKILEQVKVFEDKTRAKCLELCKLSLQELYAKFEIQDEFKTIVIDDLAIISNITETDKLTKSTQDVIANRVQAVFNLQSAVRIRLAELENACLKSGLKTPLERRQVEGFLKLDEVVYNNELQKILGNELKRQQEMEARAEARAEADMQKRLEQEKLRIQAEERVKAEALARAELVAKQRLPIQIEAHTQAVAPAIAELIERRAPYATEWAKQEQKLRIKAEGCEKLQEVIEAKNGVVRIEITFLADIPEDTFNQLVSQNAWNDTMKKQFYSYVNESVKIKNL